MGNTAHPVELGADDTPKKEGRGQGKADFLGKPQGKPYLFIQQLHTFTAWLPV
jgi:hypothetical protein